MIKKIFNIVTKKNMKKIFFICCSLIIMFGVVACEKCYDCTKKCGTCTKAGFATVAGCQGDSALNGYSVEAWKAYYESMGYSCSYNNTVENVCGKENKEELSGKFYECLEE